jgi:hypothetical protein
MFIGNSASRGGGIYESVDCGMAPILNCTFYGNSASVTGAGIFSELYVVNVRNTIIAFSTYGEAIGPSWPEYAYDEGVISCSDFYGNEGGDWVGIEDLYGVEGNISEDPLFCDPDNDEFSLAAPSGCLPSNNACGLLIGALGQGCGSPVGIGGGDEMVPTDVVLFQNCPNPFNPNTTILFALPKVAWATLSVYDVKGQLVRTLVSGRLNSGFRQCQWDGKDDGGTQVSTGVYFYRLTTGTRTLTKKMVLLK